MTEAQKERKRAIIELCKQRCEEYLDNNWNRIQAFRDEDDGKIAIGMEFKLQFRGDEEHIGSKCVFGKRFKDQRDDILDINQMGLPFTEGQNGDSSAPAAEEPSVAKGRKKRAAKPTVLDD